MARTKQTAKRFYKALITWTRFYLPREQEWPTWSVDHADVHVGPLADVQGCRKASLGRMVENPEQAAFIIGQWSCAYIPILTVLFPKTAQNGLRWTT